jgi:hypothetical protein
LQAFSQIPPTGPYAIETPPIGQKVYRAGEELRFSMVLIGQSNPSSATDYFCMAIVPLRVG